MYVNTTLAIIKILASVEKSVRFDSLMSVCQDFYDNIKDIDFEELDDE